MLIVDASCLYEVITNGPLAIMVAQFLDADDDQAAPHLIDAEVLGLIRRDRMLDTLDETGAQIALADMQAWPGDRYGHRAFLMRAWELRHNVRTWDALYVALAEALGATLLTLDARLARANGPRCDIAVPV